MLGHLKSPIGVSANSVTPEQAMQRIQAGAIIVDVREPAEFAQGSIAKAINIPRLQIEALGAKSLLAAGVLDRRAEVLIVCRSGTRSGSACARLQAELGDRAINLQGGLMSWIQAGLPIAGTP